MNGYGEPIEWCSRPYSCRPLTGVSYGQCPCLHDDPLSRYRLRLSQSYRLYGERVVAPCDLHVLREPFAAGTLLHMDVVY